MGAGESTPAAAAGPPPEITDNFTLVETPANLEALECGDVRSFLASLAACSREAVAPPEGRLAASLFSWSSDFYVARAPGRLDVMGGIADYSGSRVLQMPIAEACVVALQLKPDSRLVKVLSYGASAGGRAPMFEISLDELSTPDGSPLPLHELRARFAANPSTTWAAYVVGTLAVLMHEEGVRFRRGMNFIVRSDVPEGKGVSSSAALEVASMMAVLGAHALTLAQPERVAVLCQMVENLVVGAPCGIMDQMASALGRRGQLLSLLCQPARVQAPAHIPAHVRFWGLDSGVRHSVGGSDYGSVRCATFMGRAILRWLHEERGQPPPQYLVHMSPSQLAALADQLPTAVTGAVFERAFGEHGDTITAVEPAKSYEVAACTAHPVHEHFRVETFAVALAAEKTGSQLPLLGELMYQSHASYSKVGLGSERTDLLVQLVREQGVSSGLYGAKITGGGSGGTVCVLGDSSEAAEAALRRVLRQYQRMTGFSPYVFQGSSIGAVAFGALRLKLKQP